MKASALNNRAPATYLPIDGTPLTMSPGLLPLNTDFGNGSIDQNYFQLDCQYADYLAQKAQVPAHRFGEIADDDASLVAQNKALSWVRKTLISEYPSLPPIPQSNSIKSQWSYFSGLVQSDIAVITAPPQDRIITTRIAFPSGWAPERILGQSFWGLHGPVPTFANRQRNAENLAKAMCTKGPFVRFVWTVCGDNLLDHHPSTYRPKWDGATGGYLRVERQTTVPLENCAVFLIRTYLYPIDELGVNTRILLGTSLKNMPANLAHYKGLTDINKALANRLLD